MKEEFDSISNTPRHHEPVMAGQIEKDRRGHFTAVNPLDDKGKGTHKHKWLMGTDNAVCSRCGYTLPKRSPLPIKGLQQ